MLQSIKTLDNNLPTNLQGGVRNMALNCAERDSLVKSIAILVATTAPTLGVYFFAPNMTKGVVIATFVATLIATAYLWLAKEEKENIGKAATSTAYGAVKESLKLILLYPLGVLASIAGCGGLLYVLITVILNYCDCGASQWESPNHPRW
jgi:hypothetical protein